MCIYCDYCVYHYKSTELVSLYTLNIGLHINIILRIINRPFNDEAIKNDPELDHNFNVLYT